MRLVTVFAIGAGLLGGTALASEPVAAPFRSAFEAQFPKAEATAAALELERAAASLGIDLVPRGVTSADRPRPSAEQRKTSETAAFAITEFVNRELRGAEEKIGKPPETVERFLSENDGAIARIESILAGGDVQWEVDVSREHPAPSPNFQGMISLHRVLVARALAEARGGDTQRALQTLEASWRLNEVLSNRPEFSGQFLLISGARLDVGALRKVDSPAYSWTDRLRGGSILSGFLAALQNQAWMSSSGAEDLTGEPGGYGRALRQVADEIQGNDLCDWSPEKVREAWKRAFRDQAPQAPEPAAPNILEIFLRVRRFLVEAELTALVLDARAGRAASRERAWPAKLSTLGRGVCGNAGWSYRPSRQETAAFSFDGRLAEGESRGLTLPLAFTAGARTSPAPAPTKKPSPRPTPRVRESTVPR
jgi:hypothetical protein